LVGLLALPQAGWGDCVNLGGSFLGGFTSFATRSDNRVILYAGEAPVMQFDLLDCQVDASSKIRLLKSYMCDGDRIEIDGTPCVMLSVKPLN
jgi:hypothetical protein